MCVCLGCDVPQTRADSSASSLFPRLTTFVVLSSLWMFGPPSQIRLNNSTRFRPDETAHIHTLHLRLALPESAQRRPILGLNLLYLLVENRLAEFHSEVRNHVTHGWMGWKQPTHVHVLGLVH